MQQSAAGPGAGPRRCAAASATWSPSRPCRRSGATAPLGIAESLAEILPRTLALDLAYVKVCSAHEPDVEVVHDRQAGVRRAGGAGGGRRAGAAAAGGGRPAPCGAAPGRRGQPAPGGAAARAPERRRPVGRGRFPAGLSQRGRSPAARRRRQSGRHGAAAPAGRGAAAAQRERPRRSLHALTEADRRKDEFLAMLAHELRNPLAPIRNARADPAAAEAARRPSCNGPAR